MPEWGERYRTWVASRVAFMDRIVRPGLWCGTTVLEVGAGHGWIGDALRARGALVTQTDGRPDYVRPGGAVLDLEAEPLPVPPHDAVVAFGVLYHVRHPLRVLEALCGVAQRFMLMETEVLDTDDPDASRGGGDTGWDGALHGYSTTYAAAAFERCWAALGWHYRRFDDAALNTASDRYDWEVQGRGGVEQGYRRFWVAWRMGLLSPLREGVC